ncbi:uromodulin-like [Ranitomeya variabilis]|uniref:uromodulin-like n=1 Tax=Ranitomeya variabilis TaxID=490064 RepID=UPI0040570093
MNLLYIVLLVAALKYAEAGCYDGPIVACEKCVGSCDTGPCFCVNAIDPCVPTTADVCLSETNECCPADYYYDTTANCCTNVSLCNPSCADDEICTSGECVCNGTFYKNKTINDLRPLVVCESDVMLISISSCLLTYLKYDSTTMYVGNNGSSSECTAIPPIIENNVRVDNIQAELISGWCGNIITNDSKLIYISNTIHIGVLPNKLITVNPLRFNFTCAYNMTMQIALGVTIHPLVGTTTIPGINGSGSFDLTMAAYTDSSYTIPFTQDDVTTVGTDIYLGLYVTGADGNLLAVRVENCFASSTNSSAGDSVTIVTGGCPGSDVSTTVIQNGVSLEARIRFSLFKFQGTDSVYVFCDVRMCTIGNDCVKSCSSRSSRSSDTNQVMISVPYDYVDSSSPVSNSALPWAVLCSTLLGFLTIKLY